METKIYTHEELHKLDPAKLISHAGQEMTVLEVIRHLIDGRWPEKPEQASQTEQSI
jgi:hypothetical protein